MQALLQTTGQAPAFGPPGEAAPAALLPFLGAPLADAAVRWLDAQGARTIVLLLRERPWLLASHLEASPPAQARLVEVLERDASAGLRRAQDAVSLADEPVVVVRGTIVTDAPLQPALKLHAEGRAGLTVGLVPRTKASEGPGLALDAAGFVAAAGHEGPFAPAGILVVDPRALLAEEPGAGWLDEALLTRALAEGVPVRGVPLSGFWCDAGTPDGYAQALAAVLAGRVKGAGPQAAERAPGIWVSPSARVDHRARLLAPCHIAAGARIGPEAEVGPGTSVEEGALVARGAVLRGCVVLPGTHVGVGTRWQAHLLYPGGHLALQEPGARAQPSDDPARLGDTWRPALQEQLHSHLDRALAALALVALAPLMGAIALAIKLDSPGPVLFVQLRAGQDRRPGRPGLPRAGVFPCFKFRTMHPDAERRVAELRARNQYRDGAFFKLEDDPRVTRLGAWLRRTSLDELPQLLNVLRGEMRLVGNRPLPLYEAEALTEDWQRTRFLAPAGITGLWQISGRSELSERERLALDAFYSITRSFWGDLGILLRTVPALLARRGAR